MYVLAGTSQVSRNKHPFKHPRSPLIGRYMYVLKGAFSLPMLDSLRKMGKETTTHSNILAHHYLRYMYVLEGAFSLPMLGNL